MSADRLPTLDGLRGIAVMGIVLMNIAAFALPEAAYSNPRAVAATALDHAVWAVEFVVVDGKMRALFSLLFGASMLLVIRRAEGAGQDGQRVHFRRMAWLLLIGLVHALLVWHGDILTLYALTGCLAWFFIERSERTLWRNAIVLLGFQLLIWGTLLLLTRATIVAAAAADADPAAVARWQGLNALMGLPTAADLQREIALYTGDYGTLVRHRLARFTPFYQLIAAAPETLAYMLLGMIGLRSGFLSGGWERDRYRRLAMIGYALSVPPTVALAAWCFARDFDPLTVATAANLASLPFRPLMATAHAALILYWLTGGSSPFRERIIAAGRAAFTNYLGTSLVLTMLFYGHGLGLFGALSRTTLLAVVAAIWLVMLAWSKPWLDRFRYGPLEWLWRSLAQGRPAPMRRKDIARRSH